MRIGLLNNLRAGRSDTQVSRLLGLLKSYPDVVHAETSSAGAVPEALADLADQGVDLLVVNGGDGTLQHALTEILGHREFGGRVPLVSVLRGGRTNMTALDLGCQRDPVRSMADLIEAARGGTLADRIVERRVLRVESARDRQVLYGMFFGPGVIARGIETVHRVFPAGRSQGVFGATVVTGALLARLALLRDAHGTLSPDKLDLRLDGLPVERAEYTLAMACTLDRLFASMRPFWGEGSGGVRFTSVASGARNFWKVLPGILAGRPGRGVNERNGYVSCNVKRIDLRMDCGFTVDGELVEPSPDRVVTVTARDVVRFVRA